MTSAPGKPQKTPHVKRPVPHRLLVNGIPLYLEGDTCACSKPVSWYPDSRCRASRPMRKLGESSECSVALGIPKVALLYLTLGDMPLEEVQLPAPNHTC